MQASQLILAALVAKQRNPAAVKIDVSLFEASLSWQYLALNDQSEERNSSLLNGGAACYNIYQTSDGAFVTLGAIETHFWQGFCEAMDRPQWIERQFEQMPQTRLIDEVSQIFGQQPLKVWERLFEAIDCCFEVIRTRNTIEKHPQIIARKALSGKLPHYPAWIDYKPVAIDNEPIELDAQDIQWD